MRASITLVGATLHIRRLFLAIIAISFFWAMGAVLAAQFPPLVKNALGAQYSQASGTLQAHVEGTPMLGLQVGL